MLQGIYAVKTSQQLLERYQPPASYPGEDTKFATRRETILLEAERIAKMGSYEWDVRTGNVYRSDELCRIFGVTLEQFKPSFDGYLERVHPEDRDRTRTTIENAFRQKIPFEFEERIVHPDGTVRNLHSQGKWIFDSEQAPVKLVGICQDVTERKRAEEKLRESEERYRAVVENVPEGIIVTVEEQIVFANAAVAAMLGITSAAELLGRDILEFVPADLHPWVRQRREYMIRTGLPVPPAEGKLQANGGVVDVELTGSPIAYHGCKAILRSFRNITESKFAAGLLAAEKHVLECIANRKALADILEGICERIEVLNPPVMASIMLLDPDAKHMHPAAAPSLPDRWKNAITPLAIGPIAGACGTAAYTRHTVVAEDISQDPLWTAFPEVLKIALDCGLRACWSTPILSADEELLGTFAMYYRECRIPVPRDFDLIKQVTDLASVAIEHDRAVTGLQRAHDELEKCVEQRTAELAIANRGLEAFVAAVSHDLRSPLIRINSLTEILVLKHARELTEESRDYLNRIVTECRHMGNLVEALLKLSRATHNALQIEKLDLSQIASEIADELQQQQPDRRVEFVIARGLFADADPVLFRAALRNLLENAWKFTSRKEHSRIEFGVVSGERRTWFVRDNGAGFESRRAAEVFTAFHRLHSHKDFPGSGIGLATVHQIISRHGGQIWAEAAPEQGATFYFTLA